MNYYKNLQWRLGRLTFTSTPAEIKQHIATQAFVDRIYDQKKESITYQKSQDSEFSLTTGSNPGGSKECISQH